MSYPGKVTWDRPVMTVVTCRSPTVRICAALVLVVCLYTMFKPSNRSRQDTNMMQQPRIKFDPNFKNPCWYERGKLHCLPYFFIIGCKKAGTTGLMMKIARHPDFVDPGFREAQWFAKKRFEHSKGTGNINDYASLFDNVAEYIWKHGSPGPDGNVRNMQQFTGEKSPSNLHINSHWKEDPENMYLSEPRILNIDYIHRFLPNAKIVILVRNPVERLYSDYYHEFGTLMPGHKTSAAEFHALVERGLNLFNVCFKTRSVRSCVYEPQIYQETKIQIQLGIFYVYLQDLLRLYDRKHILIVKAEDMRTSLNTVVKTVIKFLGVRELTDKEMTKYKLFNSITGKPVSTRKPMLKKTSKMLYDFYKPFNKILATLTNDTHFLYKEQR